ncbi:Na+/H+ antiporter subunit C [Desulfurococcus mucosus]|uniref:NADH-ubiquinone oxidoreductase chain 4L n=1 Tax=Desulfurococcus mucosus (strain ATCC 35584 / DSM 2162 / JCM 9187 / O7/1) TaxID=765177 RepID=E8R9Y6_DESM0|nr:Na+/H+ antiporter subunit C [Desulfurococcus mucosus]ADV65312.1 NADH-ubiquinone oxidoreductase chain 4L [Desulfurococcus mucosus DSM 2162]
MSLDAYIWYYIMVTVVFTIAYSLYGVATRPHIVKKLVFITILSDAVYVLLVFMGYRLTASTPPVYPGGTLLNPQLPWNPSEVVSFIARSVDPVPQVLIVTAIVIGLAQLIFLSAIALRIVKATGTFNVNRLEVAEDE